MALTQLFGFHAFLAELLGHALQSLWMPSEERSGPLATVPDRGTLVSSDMLLRWHRHLEVNNWAYSNCNEKKSGRSRTRQLFVDLTVKFSKEKPMRGYDRTSGALSNVGYHITDTTIGNILKAHGIEPAPDRKRTGSWATFMKSHWDVMASIDFTTV